jgi:hypothetical protein
MARLLYDWNGFRVNCWRCGKSLANYFLVVVSGPKHKKYWHTSCMCLATGEALFSKDEIEKFITVMLGTLYDSESKAKS